MKQRVLEASLLAAALAVIAFAYRDATYLFWTYDDAFLLRVVDHADLNDYFGSQPFWRSMPSQMFVPLLLAWYELGSRAGGAAGFYTLAIALLLLALCASYVAMRRWLGPVESLTGVVIIGLGACVIAVVTQLMATHYLIALACSAMAFYFGPPSGVRRSIVSAAFYLAAILAKEIAIPLPLLLVLVPGARLTHVVPHAVALVLYFTWRHLMIGTLLGGYGWAVTAHNADDLLLALPRQLAGALTVGAIVLLIAIVVRLRSRRAIVAFVVACAAAIVPVLPVARELQPRYAFAAWVTLAVFFAIAARGRPVWCAAGALTTAVVFAVEWPKAYASLEAMSAESRFVMRAPPDATLRLPRTPPAAMGELQWHRARAGAPAGLQWFYDDVWLCGGRHRGRRVFEYDAASRRIVDRTRTVDTIAARHCGAIRDDVPLDARFRFRDGTLFWTFGPYEHGTWRVILADGLQAFTVPREDAYILGDLPALTLRVRYDAPEGWTTYSPDIALDLQRHSEFRWHR